QCLSPAFAGPLVSSQGSLARHAPVGRPCRIGNHSILPHARSILEQEDSRDPVSRHLAPRVSAGGAVSRPPNVLQSAWRQSLRPRGARGRSPARRRRIERYRRVEVIAIRARLGVPKLSLTRRPSLPYHTERTPR